MPSRAESFRTSTRRLLGELAAVSMSGVAAVRGRHGPSGRTSALPSGEAHGGLVASAAVRTGSGRAVAHSVQDRVPGAGHAHPGWATPPNPSSAPSSIGTLLGAASALPVAGCQRFLRSVQGWEASSGASTGPRAAPCPSPRSVLGPGDGPGSGERCVQGSRARCRHTAASRGLGLAGGALLSKVRAASGPAADPGRGCPRRRDIATTPTRTGRSRNGSAAGAGEHRRGCGRRSCSPAARGSRG